MKKLSKIIIALLGMAVVGSCSTLQQVLNLTQCKYDYNSISDMSVAGINTSQGISLTQLPQILALLTGNTKSVPLDFLLNLDVTNPNEAAAMLNGMEYMLSIDGIQFTTGAINDQINIPAGSKTVMPMRINFDAATLLQGDTADAAVNVIKNFIGVSDKKTQVKLDIKPSIMVGSQKLTSPVYIPVNFEYGGKK